MQSLRYLILFAFLFAGQYCTAQDWQLFPLGQKSIFLDGSATHGVVYAFVADSMRMEGNVQITCLNSKAHGLFCKPEALNFMYYREAPGLVMQTGDTAWMDSIPFVLNAQTGDSVVANGYVVTCLGAGTENVMGATDSMRTYGILSKKSGENCTLKLSKSFGLLTYIPPYYITNLPAPQGYSNKLFGWELGTAKRGYHLSEFLDYYPYTAGDVLLWKETLIDLSFGQNKIIGLFFTRDSLTNVQKTTDSVVYISDRTYYSYSSGLSHLSQFRQVFHAWKFNSLPGWAAFNLTTTPNPYIPVEESTPEAFSIDTVAHDTFFVRKFYSQLWFINAITCQLGQVTDTYEGEMYDTRNGLISWNSETGNRREGELIGHRKNGVVSGNINLPVSVVEPLANPLQLYPNPTDNVLTIAGVQADAIYSIHTMQGQVVQQGRVGQQPISVSGLPQGIYLLRVAANGAAWQKRFTRM